MFLIIDLKRKSYYFFPRPVDSLIIDEGEFPHNLGEHDKISIYLGDNPKVSELEKHLEGIEEIIGCFQPPSFSDPLYVEARISHLRECLIGKGG